MYLLLATKPAILDAIFVTSGSSEGCFGVVDRISTAEVCNKVDNG